MTKRGFPTRVATVTGGELTDTASAPAVYKGPWRPSHMPAETGASPARWDTQVPLPATECVAPRGLGHLRPSTLPPHSVGERRAFHGWVPRTGGRTLGPGPPRVALPPMGLAAAMTVQRAWREVTMPALEMEMLCCSMASWMLVLSWSFICVEGQRGS